MSWRVITLAVAAATTACGDGSNDDPTAIPPQPVKVVELNPGVVLPRSTLVVTGAGFVAGVGHTLLLKGTTAGDSGGSITVDLPLSLRRVDDQTATHVLTDDEYSRWGPGIFSGTAAVRSTSASNGVSTDGAPVVATIRLVTRLTPEFSAVAGGLAYLNSRVAVVGNGLLVATSEGWTTAEISGCFLPDSATAPCSTNGTTVKTSAAVQAESSGKRDRGYFILDPSILGISPGKLTGKIILKNTHWDRSVRSSAPRTVSLYLDISRLDRFDQTSVSLGQYLDLRGKGFVGGTHGSTSVAFSGIFTPSPAGSDRTVSFHLVPAFVSGEQARYVVEEKAGIGASIAVRREIGTISGSWTPTIYWKDDKQQGGRSTVKVAIAPVRQVVWVRFVKGWTEALAGFGLRAADSKIRQRILAVLKRDYQGINVEFRTVEPKDFKLFAKVDIGGTDPNGLGLLGYDNTPGKDVDNRRLYDWIGGVNAVTQEDGYPGYGGVFLESLFGFSQHPPSGIAKSHMNSKLFDQIFDPFRPDRGHAVTAAETLKIPRDGSTSTCPETGNDRVKAASCAVLVLGNVIGSTAAHELGHSLGLADPYGLATDLHNPGDATDRLMDAGRYRPFSERAELLSEGPARFCKEEFTYLQKILPPSGSAADPVAKRPSCY